MVERQGLAGSARPAPDVRELAVVLLAWKLEFTEIKANDRILVYNLEIKIKRHIYLHFPKAYKGNLVFKVK